jgi:hypothetical protein
MQEVLRKRLAVVALAQLREDAACKYPYVNPRPRDPS